MPKFDHTLSDARVQISSGWRIGTEDRFWRRREHAQCETGRGSQNPRPAFCWRHAPL